MRALRAVAMILIDALKAYAVYIAIVFGGTALVMFAADSVGYLSYSDRPGPGWYGLHPHFSISDAEFIVGFVAFAAVLSVFTVVVPGLMLLAVALRRWRARPFIVGLVIGPLIALATVWVFAAAGWYVAIGAPFIVIAAALSALFACAISGPAGVRLGRFRLRAF
jgi:hypothetical protein